MHEYYSVKETAERLGLPVASIRRWVREGVIPALRVGRRSIRIPKEWVEEAKRKLDESMSGATPDAFVAKLRGERKG